MIKRPGRNENEEDLLRFQDEFFSSDAKPSVVINKPNKNKRDVVQLQGLQFIISFSIYFIACIY